MSALIVFHRSMFRFGMDMESCPNTSSTLSTVDWVSFKSSRENALDL